MHIQENIEKLRSELPPRVKLIAVSKTRPASDIEEAYRGGQLLFGENRAQELASKASVLPSDINWHMIGHLQTNKIKYVIPAVSLIHSVDSYRLLKEINREAQKCSRIIPCLLQFHIAEEETKFGFNLPEAIEMLGNKEFYDLKNIRIAGVMGMATFVDDMIQVRKEFAGLKKIYDNLKSAFFLKNDEFCEISMGMSGDYRIALEEGSTMVRIGSSIFGDRVRG